MREIYLIRHGKTAGNMEKRYVGSTDEPLCEAGVCEINERRNMILRSFLKEYERDGMSQIKAVYAGGRLPERIYVSPMLRCRQTAGLLFPDALQEAVADFREMDFGAFEYKNYKELSGDVRYQAYIDSGGAIDFPGAEPQGRFRQRVRKAFEKCLTGNETFMANFASGQSGDPFVFVVHGGTIMAIMEAYARPHRDYFDWQVDAACGYHCVISYERESIYLEQVTRI